MYTQFWPKTAFFWSRGANFDPKPKKYSETSCYNPKPCIPGQNLVSERLCHFWGLQAPQPSPRPPQTPPMVPGAQKWLKCTCTSPVLIINDKKTTFGWVNILTYFFTRNVPNMTVLILMHKQREYCITNSPPVEWNRFRGLSNGATEGVGCCTFVAPGSLIVDQSPFTDLQMGSRN